MQVQARGILRFFAFDMETPNIQASFQNNKGLTVKPKIDKKKRLWFFTKYPILTFHCYLPLPPPPSSDQTQTCALVYTIPCKNVETPGKTCCTIVSSVKSKHGHTNCSIGLPKTSVSMLHLHLGLTLPTCSEEYECLI